jgi:hypothetical protein
VQVHAPEGHEQDEPQLQVHPGPIVNRCLVAAEVAIEVDKFREMYLVA